MVWLPEAGNLPDATLSAGMARTLEEELKLHFFMETEGAGAAS